MIDFNVLPGDIKSIIYRVNKEAERDEIYKRNYNSAVAEISNVWYHHFEYSEDPEDWVGVNETQWSNIFYLMWELSCPNDHELDFI